MHSETVINAWEECSGNMGKRTSPYSRDKYSGLHLPTAFEPNPAPSRTTGTRHRNTRSNPSRLNRRASSLGTSWTYPSPACPKILLGPVVCSIARRRTFSASPCLRRSTRSNKIEWDFALAVRGRAERVNPLRIPETRWNDSENVSMLVGSD